MESHGDDRGGEVRGGVVSGERLDCDADTRVCVHCVHYRLVYAGSWSIGSAVSHKLDSHCALNRRLEPCSDYEREPGADDE